MPKYNVIITSEETSYTTYKIEVEAKSLEEAKVKANKLAEDDDGDFADTYADCCDPGDSYETFKVQDVQPK